MRAALPSPLSPALLATLAPLLPVVLVLPGCTGSVSGAPGGGDAETTVTHAVVLVERTFDTGQAAQGTRAATSARFARVAAGASAGDTLRAIGAALELPAQGACASVHPAEPGTVAAESTPVVELLDVGRVSVEASGSVTALVPRQLPYVTDVVTGTVYARAAEAAALPAATSYGVHVAGTRDFPAFEVLAAAPADPDDVSIAQETSPGKIVSTGATVDFAWPGSAAGDLLYLEVQPAAVRCTLGGALATGGAGVSHASIPSSLLDDAGSLVVHRLHTVPLQVRGIDDGELRFDFARAVAYVKR